MKKNRKDLIKNNLKPLLSNTPETYYWIGFLMADGSISKFKKYYKLSIGLSIKDINHYQSICRIRDLSFNRGVDE